MVLSTRSSTADPFIVSLDVGSSSVRALLFDASGRQVEGYRAQLTYREDATPDGGVEVNPECLAELTIDPNPFALAVAEAAFAPNRLGQAFPTASTYIYHSIFDQLLPIRGLDLLVDTYRRGGVDVTYRRGWLGEHVLYAALGAFGAVRFLAGRFDNAAVTANRIPMPEQLPTAQAPLSVDQDDMLEPSA